METAETVEYPLFCIGQPLLDIQVTDGAKLLEKYNLHANDGILADDTHLPMCVQLFISALDS